MSYQTVADIYEGNEKIRQKFEAVIAPLAAEHAGRVFEGEKWSIAEIVEHVSMVEDGTSRICAKLLAKAEADGTEADGRVEISPAFFTKSDEIAAIKIEAPERVHPSAGSTIAQSLERMKDSHERFEALRPAFEKFDCRNHTFPHPFFGDITAVEWLVLAGGHKARHLRQIQRLIDKM
jgi:hypothetical protein